MIEELDLPHIPEWDGPEKAIGDMYRWSRDIGYNHLVIRHLRDKVTRKFITEGIFWDVSQLMGQRWIIQNGRKFVLDIQLSSWGDLRTEDCDLAVTGIGPGEVIDDDVSTPKKMAAYLERLAKK
ncbi:MAG: hypothetical protein PHQ34_01365 [Methanothrix sp.]|nr:hypothetical protein [Methanothrix sp.]